MKRRPVHHVCLLTGMIIIVTLILPGSTMASPAMGRRGEKVEWKDFPGKESSTEAGEAADTYMQRNDLWNERDLDGGMGYQEWLKSRTPQPDHIRQAFRPYEVSPSRDLVLVLVSENIYDAIAGEVAQYLKDLSEDGFDPWLAIATFSSAESLKSYLSEMHHAGISGVTMIGDFPSAWYEMDWQSGDRRFVEEFPCDLFLMDLDGTFADEDEDGMYDAHEGKKDLEIWVGRIIGSNLTYEDLSEAEFIARYLRKNHLYREGALELPDRALLYVDDDWVNYAELDASFMARACQEVTVISDPEQTTREDYLLRLQDGYRWLEVVAHSLADGHEFYEQNRTLAKNVDSWDIYTARPRSSFVNLMACNAADFLEQDFLAGCYVMSDSHVITALGSTKVGAIDAADFLFLEAGKGRSIGEAFRRWFNTGSAYNPRGAHNPEWHQGLAIIGDPMARSHERKDEGLPRTWYLAEGCTQGGMETFILVQNPNEEGVEVDVTFMTSSGAVPGPRGIYLPPGTRRTFLANQYVSSWDVSTRVDARGGGVICERAMYGAGRTWAHDSLGSSQTFLTWYLAEGCTQGGMETFILVQNPNDDQVAVSAIYMTESGEVLGQHLHYVSAKSRITLKPVDYVRNWDVSARIEAWGGGIICERSMMDNNRIWAHDSLGRGPGGY